MEAPTLSPRRTSREDIIAGMGGSILAHAIIFSLAIILPLLTPKRSFQVPFYSVNLVSMQDIGMGQPSSKGKSSPQAEGSKGEGVHKSSSASHAKSGPLVPVKRLDVDEPTRKVETQIKKMDAPDLPKMADSSLDKTSIEKNLEKLIPKPKIPSPPQPVAQNPRQETAKAPAAKPSGAKEPDSKDTRAASNTEHKSEDKNTGTGGNKGTGNTAEKSTGTPGDKSSPSSQTGTAKGNTEGNPGNGADGAQIASARQLYYKTIQDLIQRHWSLPEFLKAQKLEAEIALVVRRDGKILDIKFETRSGQPLFDESLERAVRKSDPLPPFPPIYSPEKEEILFHFIPS